MIEVLINGQAQEVAEGSNIEQIVEQIVEQFAGSGPFAVALNGQFVGKENYAKTAVTKADKIDILSPIQGG